MITRLLRRLRSAPGIGVPPSVLQLLADAADRADARAEAGRWARSSDSYAREAAEMRAQRDEAHRREAYLLAWLAALHPASAVVTPAPGEDGEAGWLCMFLRFGGWQGCWPIAPENAPLFREVELVDRTDPRAQWDGHGREQLLMRVRFHTRLLHTEHATEHAAELADQEQETASA